MDTPRETLSGSPPPAEPPTLPPSPDHVGDPAVEPRVLERVGEYDLLEEIARGGMGVVFRARHRQLGRLVALKMILGGRLASAAEVQRFRVEAEAAAQLDHPGIVPIYEIGEHQGQPFFAMKLIEGSSLSQRLVQLRGDLRAGVALLARVARAVQHAHERGILHRDLKPSNILLDGEGTPLVTDFGLAKHLAGPGGKPGESLTQSGAIVGTPSYMAPEQAGSARQATTAADVYSLGAILYELLTGRPPHIGPTAMEIMLKLLAQDVTPPRELSPRVDRELEAICLKCLAWKPEDRYATAAALAADLDSWLAGEPISLRGAALATHVRTWLRQNLRTAGRTLAVGLTCGVFFGFVTWVRLGKNVAWLDGVYRRLPSVHRPWVLYMPVLPDWFSGMVSMLIMLLLLGTGFVTAVVVRPTTRHAAVAAGLAVGFITAVTTLLMALGGFMMQMQTQSAIEYDLTILSEAAFTRAAPGEPHPSDRLLARYPDLQQVPPGERGHLIRDKILGDSLAGILVGLWLGAASALLLSLVPLVSGTVAAWSLLQRHGSVLGALFPYTELTFTVTILAGVIVHWVLGPLATSYILFPEVPWLLAVLAACSLGVIAICLRWPITLRLLVHLVWIGALLLLTVHEADYGTTEGRAARLVQAGQFSAAAEQLEQILQRQPDRVDTRFRAAIVWLRAGDQEHYERHCQKLLEDARQTSDPSVADKAAKVCLLGGEHVPDLAVATKLADQAVRLGAGHAWTNYYELVRGMAAYRNQQDPEALDWLRKCQAAKNRDSATTALVFEAMALQRQGSHVDALLALEHADTMFRELEGSRAASADWPSGFNWIDLVIFEIARREAARVVEQAPAQP